MILMLSYVWSKGFPSGSVVKNPPANAGDATFNPWIGKTPLEKEMAIHCSIFAW